MLKGLVDLAFVLMAVENKSKTGLHPLWQIGLKILQKIMRKHHETVPTIFQTLIDKIIAGGSCISQYTSKFFLNIFFYIRLLNSTLYYYYYNINM